MYEREDYEYAIELLAGGILPLSRMICAVLPLRDIAQAFTTIESDPAAMKILIDCGGRAQIGPAI